MPQFDVVNFAPQFVWLAITFLILYFGIVRPTLPKLGRTVDARDQQKRDDVATAERAKAEADRMAAEYEAGVATAHDSARARVDDARAKAAKSLEAKLAASNVAIGERSTAAAASLDMARAQAMARIEDVAADAAADIVEKLTGSRPDADAAASAARVALA